MAATPDAAKRKELAKKGHAMPDGSFPIQDHQDVKDAVQTVGRSSNPAAAKSHIVKRAKALKATHLLPDKWKKNY